MDTTAYHYTTIAPRNGERGPTTPVPTQMGSEEQGRGRSWKDMTR